MTESLYCKNHIPFDMKSPYEITDNPEKCLHCQWRIEMKKADKELQKKRWKSRG